MPSENRPGEWGEVKIEPVTQNNRACTAPIFQGLFPIKLRIEQEHFLGSEKQVRVAKKDQINYSASPSSLMALMELNPIQPLRIQRLQLRMELDPFQYPKNVINWVGL